MEIKIMSLKRGQTFNATQKTKIVLEALKEEETIAQIASKHKTTSQSINKWKKQFLENATLAFDVGGVTKSFQDEITQLKSDNDNLAKALGKATVREEYLQGKLKSLVSISKRKELIETKHKNGLSVKEQCELLVISRTAYYYKVVPPSNHKIKVMHAIDEIATENADYGYRLIHKQLLEDGYTIGKDRVLKYMQYMGIQALYPKPKVSTSAKNKAHKIYPYLLKKYWSRTSKRNSVYVPTPNEVWSGDITYIRMSGGFVYLAAVIDWHSKAILAYKISTTMDATLATDVLQEALEKYPKPKIFNSDQGSQYTSKEHTDLLKKYDVEISMNGRARSIHNIAIERFFRTLKYSDVYINNYQTIKELKQGVKAFMHKYNFKRFHMAIDYKKPMNYYLEFIKSVA